MMPWRTLSLLCSVFFWMLVSAELRASEPSVNTPAADAKPGAGERSSFAVVIGNNASLGRRRPDLHYADDDAARYFQILQSIAPGRVMLLTSFDRDSTRLFADEIPHAAAPTLRNLRAAGQRLAAEVRAARAAGKETELYVVFAGHGDVAEGEGFIELADQRFRSSELRAWLGGIPFHRAHVILDSCNSFFMLGVRKPGGRHFATSEDATRALASNLPNVGVFLSTNAEGEAFEWSEIQSGIFSHLVRSGLLGGADANADGSVSYLELAAFVDTATSGVRNPNMRPRVFARGPGASDEAPIARLQSMNGVRRFQLGDTGALRVRVRDRDGLPLLDAHMERAVSLRVALPEAWARGAVVERAGDFAERIDSRRAHALYAVPDAPDVVTLAALQSLSPTSQVRGPDETFQSLFSQPFGPRALAEYVTARRSRPAPVYGVSREDARRMALLLDQLSQSERGRRVNESIGGIGFGLLLGGAGIGVLNVDDGLSSKEKTEARVLGGVLLGMGGLFVLGGAGSLLAKSKAEAAADEFNTVMDSGGDPAAAFALADERIRALAEKRRVERIAEGVAGSLIVLGAGTGLIWSELAAESADGRMAPRLGWSAGMVGGGLMIADAILTETPVDSLTRIWREDPSLHQYRPIRPLVSLSHQGAFVGLSGEL